MKLFRAEKLLQSIALIRAGKLKMVYYGRYVIAYS